MNKNKGFPQIKKDIQAFLTQEEGSMARKDVIKVGLGLLAISAGLGGAAGVNEANADCSLICDPCHASHSSHASY